MIKEWDPTGGGRRALRVSCAREFGAVAGADPAGVVTPPRRWHVLQTRSRHEKAVAGLLHDSGAEPFLPVVPRVVHYGHRRRTQELPVFSNYVFLWGTHEHAWQAMRSGGVVQSVPVADQRTLSRELDQIRRAIRGEAALSPYRFLERGVRVRVTSGPFKDIEGIVVEHPRGTRLVLQIHSLGRATCLEIDACLLERISDEEGCEDRAPVPAGE